MSEGHLGFQLWLEIQIRRSSQITISTVWVQLTSHLSGLILSKALFTVSLGLQLLAQEFHKASDMVPRFFPVESFLQSFITGSFITPEHISQR